MHLHSLLNPHLICYTEHNLSKEQVIKLMIDKICSNFQYKNCAERILDLIINRERESSTVYPTGIAIPHIRLDGLDDTIIAVCVPRHPVQDSDQQVKLYILILTDKNVSSLYLNVVAAFMRVSKDTDLFNKLLASDTADNFINIIKSSNIKIKDEVTVSDVMTTVPYVINENVTIKTLAEFMKDKGLYYIPVVNDNGDWVGDVNLLHYLEASIPDYMKMMHNVNFLRSFEPFEHLYKKEDEVLVRQVMSKPERQLSPDQTIIQAVFEMVRQKKQTFSVIKDNKVVGILTAMDIYKKVVRA